MGRLLEERAVCKSVIALKVAVKAGLSITDDMCYVKRERKQIRPQLARKLNKYDNPHRNKAKFDTFDIFPGDRAASLNIFSSITILGNVKTRRVEANKISRRHDFSRIIIFIHTFLHFYF